MTSQHHNVADFRAKRCEKMRKVSRQRWLATHFWSMLSATYASNCSPTTNTDRLQDEQQNDRADKRDNQAAEVESGEAECAWKQQ